MNENKSEQSPLGKNKEPDAMYDIIATAVVLKLFSDTSCFSIAIGFALGVAVASKYPQASYVVQRGGVVVTEWARHSLDRINQASREWQNADTDAAHSAAEPIN